MYARDHCLLDDNLYRRTNNREIYCANQWDTNIFNVNISQIVYGVTDLWNGVQKYNVKAVSTKLIMSKSRRWGWTASYFIFIQCYFYYITNPGVCNVLGQRGFQAQQSTFLMSLYLLPLSLTEFSYCWGCRVLLSTYPYWVNVGI